MKRAGAILLALAVVAISCAFGVIGLLFTGFRCWESCEDPPEVWSDDPDSWQWDALGALGLATIASAIVLLVLVILKRRTASWIALGRRPSWRSPSPQSTTRRSWGFTWSRSSRSARARSC